MNSIQKEFADFAKDLEKRLKVLGLTFHSFPVDHVCYRAENLEDYIKYKDLFTKNCVLYTEKHFHERNFNLFVLRSPLCFKEIKFHYLEFAQPGGSDQYKRGFQHFEYLTNKKWKEIVRSNLLSKLLHSSKYGEEYLKWEDKIVVKITDTSQITKALLEDNSKIFLEKT